MSAIFRHQLLGSSPAASAAFSTCSYCSFVRRNVMFLDRLISLLSSISILQVSRKGLYTGSYPVYTFVYNAYKNLLTPLFVKVDIVDKDVYNVDISAPNSGGDVSNTSQVRSTYCACIQVWITDECRATEFVGHEL